MFGLSTLIQMNKLAAARFKKTGSTNLEWTDHKAPKSESTKVKEFEQELREQAAREDFVVTSKGPNGGLLVTPTNEGAKALLKKLFAFSDDYRGASVILKHRDWSNLLFSIQAAGMTALRQ